MKPVSNETFVRTATSFIESDDTHVLFIKSDLEGNQDEGIEVTKDIFTVNLKQWNGESNITITPQFHETDSNATKSIFVNGKVQSQRGSMVAFVKKGDKDGTFDIDFSLLEEPISNVFTYKIEGFENLDFLYQPEPSLEEIKRGIDRPENIIGSYAVFHKEKKGNFIGGTNYGSGKLFHIYRPKVTDSIGNEIWAELSYEKGVLSVTVPQDFLENASYPVIVDPTFGYTTLGATAQNNDSGFLLGQLFGTYLASTGDQITSFSVGASKPTGSLGLELAAYTFSTGLPISRLAAATTLTVNSSTPQIWTTSAVSQSLVAGTTYTVAVTSPSDDGTLNYYFDSASNNASIGAGSNLPATWSSLGMFNFRYTIFATYTAGAAAPFWQMVFK